VGVDYTWSVAIVINENSPSKNIDVFGAIRRIEPSDAVLQKINKTDKSALPHLYARERLWYDALQAISDQIDTQISNTTLREERASLLENFGLANVAAYDRRAILQGISKDRN
jgi:hypothetical protein